MLIDSVLIKLMRSGGKDGPNYNITVHGSGAVIYEGKDNVKTKGRLEEPLDKSKIMSLLSEFKSLDFFSLKEVYIMDNSAGKPYTVISLSLPVPGEEQIKTKNIMFFEEDPNVPQNLKKLANKVDETVGSARWTSFGSESKMQTRERFEERKSYKPYKPPAQTRKKIKISNKSIIMIIAIFAIIAITVFAIYAGFINLDFTGDSTNDNNNGDNGNNNNGPPPIEYNPPDIMLLHPIDNTTVENLNLYISIGQDPPKTDIFEQGDTVYIYYKFRNVTHGGRYNIIETINVFYSDAIKDSNTSTFENETEYVSFYDMCSFQTDESWLTGVYVVNLHIEDLETEKISTKTTTFTII